MKKDFGKIDIMVHSLANGPEVTKPLLETSRNVRRSRSRTGQDTPLLLHLPIHPPTQDTQIDRQEGLYQLTD